MELTAETRAKGAIPRDVRANNLIPAVLYGRGVPVVNIAVPFADFDKLYRAGGSESTIIDLQVGGDPSPYSVLIKDVQFDHVSEKYLHIDFYQVKSDEKLRTTIPLKFIGESLAVKDLDGILITNKDEIEVECLPKDLPREIEVDISQLINLNDSITVKDISVPSGVEILNDGEESVMVVTEPAAEEEAVEEVSEAEAVASVEATEEKSETEESEDKETPAE
ncbi:50S ribosomal protein L25 [Patescibacteria group bacterium]|nr:50S ribosomal protein L25 [Patescibacteria group bacterium]